MYFKKAKVQGFRFRIWVKGLGFRVQHLGFKAVGI